MKLVPEYERKSINEEAVWLYYNFPCKTSVHSIRIHNAILMDLFDDQKNLLILKFGDFEKGYEFRKEKQEISIRLNKESS
jgi:hypothetical protein